MHIPIERSLLYRYTNSHISQHCCTVYMWYIKKAENVVGGVKSADLVGLKPLLLWGLTKC